MRLACRSYVLHDYNPHDIHSINIIFVCVKVFDLTLRSPDHAAHACLQADGRGDDDPDERSRRPQPGLQSGRRHDHQRPHQHAGVCWNQPARRTK